ncbi:hypothetical protein PACTADRAFT_34135 [Pachysolen tannophilus NRRL Y-2460]|uniref:NADH:flavin oxidoreductase/NADH oxidase N-terminal domain-containing protein n=1 Tax=Pachysolen tannophilus NRRL Y-2460 TaxID=669874 RepID=A0A1E4TV01_PACTA|nr:hypothetical protein PACTADRAFT_34135 [Pachysolen tannophilus NRRL Y-2460]
MTLVDSKYTLRNTNLFKPIQVGSNFLQNRIVHAPVTRLRASIDGIPTDLMLEYYHQRSQQYGGLIVGEGAFISREASGLKYVAGIYNTEQANAWKLITDRIHQNGSFVSCQLWNMGRLADLQELKRLGLPLIAPSVVYHSKDQEKAAQEAGNELKSLTLDQIEIFKNQYVEAAKIALNVAKFDYIELNAAHGYLLDQFLQPSSNKRIDKYGGSIENRSRLILEIIDLLIKEIGDSKKLAIRISPWGIFDGMKGENEIIHPIAGIGYLVSELQQRANKGFPLAYVSVVEPKHSVDEAILLQPNQWISEIWKGPVIRTGGYLRDYKKGNSKIIENDVNLNDKTLIGFGKYFTSNPDLPERLRNGWQLTPYDPSTFATHTSYHYTDWKNWKDWKDWEKAVHDNAIGKVVSQNEPTQNDNGSHREPIPLI